VHDACNSCGADVVFIVEIGNFGSKVRDVECDGVSARVNPFFWRETASKAARRADGGVGWLAVHSIAVPPLRSWSPAREMSARRPLVTAALPLHPNVFGAQNNGIQRQPRGPTGGPRHRASRGNAVSSPPQ
jgi:hypothetical protein